MHVRSIKEGPNLLRGLSTISWWKLVPDAKHEFLTAGFGEWKKADYATAALAEDGRCAVVYLPSPRRVAIDLAKFASPVRACWFDPTSGQFAPVADKHFPNAGEASLVPPERNAAGEPDVALFFEVTP
jgi:hypothetical protein